MCLYILIIFSIFVLTVILNIFYGKQKINEEFALLKQLKDDSSCTIDVSYLSSILDYFDIIKNVRNNLKTLLDGNYQNQKINDSLAIDAIKLINLREKFVEYNKNSLSEIYDTLMIEPWYIYELKRLNKIITKSYEEKWNTKEIKKLLIPHIEYLFEEYDKIEN